MAGFTDVRICEFFEITRQTLDNYKKIHKKFFASLKKWKQIADQTVVRSLWERANGYEHPAEVIFQYRGEVVRAQTTKKYPPETLACIYWLNNRQPQDWRQKVAVDIDAPVNLLEKYKTMSSADLIEKLKEYGVAQKK